MASKGGLKIKNSNELFNLLTIWKINTIRVDKGQIKWVESIRLSELEEGLIKGWTIKWGKKDYN